MISFSLARLIQILRLHTRASAVAAALLAVSLGSVSAQQPARFLPVPPDRLLAALPLPPAEWKLTESHASSYFNAWLEAKATRTYRPVEAEPNTDPEGQIEVNVIDTGGDLASQSQFLEFQPGVDGTLERLLIAGNPALVFREPDSPVITQILIDKRFVVEITVTKLPKQEAEPWLKQIQFGPLQQLPKSPLSKLPNPIHITLIDQLHPERNRSYPLVVSDPIAGESSDAPP